MIVIIYAVLLLVVGIILITISSEFAVKHSALLASLLGVSPLIIGLSLVSVGTDLPEIFNSIISCSLGHGDIDVGDSVGSDLTQLTLIFGLVPIICGGFMIKRKEVLILGFCEILSLIVIYAVVEKGYFTRINAIIMICSLPIYIWIIYHVSEDTLVEFGQEFTKDLEKMDKKVRNKIYHLIIAIIGFVGVAISAYIIVQSIITIATELYVHEYIISFFIAALGTSLPELMVDVNAIKRRKEYKLALGDIFGSCIVDSTLSIGIGQALFPQVISAEFAVPTVLYTLLATIIVITFVVVRKKVDKKAGILFIALYFVSYLLLFLWI
jgi:cation:H+ antiporter